MKRRFCFGILLVLAFVMTGCAPKQTDEAYVAPELLPAAGVASDIAVCFRGDHYGMRVFEGFTTAYVEELSFPFDGVVDEVLVTPGQSVKAGDRLVTLNLKTQRERVETLETQVERARKSNDYQNRMTQIDISILETEKAALIASGAPQDAIALKELDIRQKKLDLQQAMEVQEMDLASSLRELEELYEILENDALIAPFDGVVARGISVGKGSRVKAYETVIQFADNTRVQFTTEYLSETYFRAATGGYYAIIGDKEYQIRQIQMDTDEYIAKMLVGETIYSNYEIIGPEGWENEVEAGMYGVMVQKTNFLADQLMIPQNAVLSDTDGKYVYVAGENGERKKRTVKIRNFTDSLYSVVLEGLEEGERIYVTDK